MHSRYAAVFGIENLQLNQHYLPKNSRPIDNHIITPSSDIAVLAPISLSSQLLADIQRAIEPLTINSVIQSASLQLQEHQLGLVNEQLNTEDKRALWALMSEHLDKL
jgi:hypothetical protein